VKLKLSNPDPETVRVVESRDATEHAQRAEQLLLAGSTAIAAREHVLAMANVHATLSLFYRRDEGVGSSS
jgi:hypothetical protein